MKRTSQGENKNTPQDRPLLSSLTLTNSQNSIQLPSIPSIVSKVYKLNVKQNFVGKWYKEKGGDGKVIKLEVCLLDCLNGLPIGNPDPSMELKLTVHYELNRKTPISNQTILRIINPDDLKFAFNQTKTNLQVRIEEISSRHCHQNFIIKIEAINTSCDIRHVFTKPIEVLTRPPKQKKNNDVSSQKSTVISTEQVTTTSTVVEKLPKRRFIEKPTDLIFSPYLERSTHYNYDDLISCGYGFMENDQVF